MAEPEVIRQANTSACLLKNTPNKSQPRTDLQFKDIKESCRGLCFPNSAKQEKNFLPFLLYPHFDLSEFTVAVRNGPEIPTHQMNQNSK